MMSTKPDEKKRQPSVPVPEKRDIAEDIAEEKRLEREQELRESVILFPPLS